jgi:hypothetical protein
MRTAVLSTERPSMATTGGTSHHNGEGGSGRVTLVLDKPVIPGRLGRVLPANCG